MSLSHRERVIKTLSHSEADRVPLDLGGTFWSTVNINVYQQLKRHFGVIAEDTLLIKSAQIAAIHEPILKALNVDFRYIAPGVPDTYHEIPVGEDGYRDAWGIIRRKPRSSYFYDVVKSPLAGEITINDVLNFTWPDPADPGFTKGLRERVLGYRRNTDYALVLGIYGGMVQFTQYLRGFDDWYIDLIKDQKLACALFDAATEQFTAHAETLLKAVGDLIDVVGFGDDLGTQSSAMFSPELYRKMVKPRHRKICETLKKHTKACILLHCCGSIAWALDDLIDVGIQAINPVQVSARDMDTSVLKKRFGDRICFWGGIDTQHVLPRGTPDDVKAEVKRRIQDLAPGGGYVLAPVHNIQPGVPVQNIIAMYEAGKEFGTYPIIEPDV